MREEISRLTRKEARTACDPLYNQIQVLKKTIRDQRDVIIKLQKNLARLEIRTPSSSQVLNSEEGGTDKVRISPASIKRHRKRLKISQGEMGQLLKVSTNTVVRWEAGTSKPRAQYYTGLAKLHSLGIKGHCSFVITNKSDKVHINRLFTYN